MPLTHKRSAVWITALALVGVGSTVAILPAGAVGPRSAVPPTCTVQIQRGTHTADVTETVLTYRDVQGAGGNHRRVIVRVRRPLRAACSASCVVTAVRNRHREAVYVKALRRVTIARNGRLIRVRRLVRVYELSKCRPGADSGVPLLPRLAYPSGTRVTITLKPASNFSFDFDQFRRVLPVTGTIAGVVSTTGAPGAGSDLTLTQAGIDLTSTALVGDDACANGPGGFRIGAQTRVGLDDTAPSVGELSASGEIHLSLRARLHLTFELRDTTTCGIPPLQTGYGDGPIVLDFHGSVTAARGLDSVVLVAAQSVWVLPGCFAPGAPTEPCRPRDVAPLPVLGTAVLLASVSFGP